jgi:type IV pilus assembly protein PilA
MNKFNKKNKRGFTLIELLVTVLILAILMAIALPLYLSAIADSERKTCRANLQTIANAEMAYRVRTRGGFTATIADLNGDLLNTPVCPNAGTYSVTVGTPPNSFTVNCNVADHNAGGNGESNGYSPGVNSQ